MKKLLCVLAVLFYAISLFDYNSASATENYQTVNVYYNSTNFNSLWKFDDYAIDTMIEKNLTIQNFSRYGNTNTVFATQHYGSKTYLIRCSIGTNGVISPIDFAELSGYGHGESVEVTDYDSSTQTYTIWVGTNVNTGSSYYWSKDIARVKYTVNSTGVSTTAIKITDIGGVLGLNTSSNRTAVSVAENDNRICFCSQLGDGNENWYYIIYSLSDLNTALNGKVEGTSHTLSSLNLQIKSSFSMVDSSLPYNSFQAIDNDGVGSNNKYLYISSGGSSEDGIINQYLYTNGGNKYKKVEYIFHTTSIPAGISGDDIDFLRNAEIEGIKVYDVSGTDYLYIMFRKNDSSKEARVFTFPVTYPTT